MINTIWKKGGGTKVLFSFFNFSIGFQHVGDCLIWIIQMLFYRYILSNNNKSIILYILISEFQLRCHSFIGSIIKFHYSIYEIYVIVRLKSKLNEILLRVSLLQKA